MNNNNNNNNNHLNTSLSTRTDANDPGSMIPSMYPMNNVSIPINSNNYLNNRNFTPVNSNSMTSELDSILSNSNNTSSNPQAYQRRKIIHHLALLLHAHKCLQREQQTGNSNNCNGDTHQSTASSTCTLPHCGTMRTVLQHMTKCSDFKTCTFNYCVQSRHIILHWKNCTSPTCVLCGTLKKPSPPRPTNQFNREWQSRLHQDHRSHLVKKIVSALLETFQQDICSLAPERRLAITNYAQKTEADTYNSANSYEDYFQRLAERIYKIRKDFEEKQMLKKQNTLSTTLTSIDTSAGEQGPPNRTAPATDVFSLTELKSEPIETHSTTVTLSSDKQRITNNTLNRLTIPNTTNNNGQMHIETNGCHRETQIIKSERVSPNHSVKISTTTVVKQEDKHSLMESSTTSSSSNSNDTTITSSIETIKTEKIIVDNTPAVRPAQVDATSKSLVKHPAVFSSEDIRQKMLPILERLYNHDDGAWFRQPVTEAIAPGYFDVIKNPMDFSTIMRKLNENQYSTPFQFCEDIWLVFNNTWTFNKKSHRVYKAGLKLADIFMDSVDSLMKDYGYCCGRQQVFLPSAMFCYGINGICCTIPRDGDYFLYHNTDPSRANLSNDKYTFCKKCFDSVKSDYIAVGDDPAQTLVDLPKSNFLQAKNDYQEQEAMTDCIVCSRRFHTVCVLYHEHIWPEGFVCETCVKQYNVKRKDNRYLAHKLTTTELATHLEKRVNEFLRRNCDPNTGRVTIRVLAASDRICEVKPRLKRYFGSQIPDGYPYRTKAIFAFQEIEGVDVVLFGMHVQEYDSRSPAPNARRVYISYLDSVHYFRPKQKRTAVYYEILIGYLEYVKQLGFIYAHIWACPPSEGDDYIFYCHPPEQRVPKPKRLQEWYKTMLDEAIIQRVVVDYKDIMKDCLDNGITKATDLPYFEGDFWSSTIEDLIKELDMEEEDRRKFEELEAVKASEDGCYDDLMEPEEPTEMSDKRKSGNATTHKKKNFKKTTSQRRAARKNMTNGSDLISKIHGMMEKHKESFFVVRLRNPMSSTGTSADTDPLIQCDLMESRDAFLNFAREKHCEFSSLRRAKYSTLTSLIELHSSTADKVTYTCNACRQPCDVRYHCTVCEDYDLCSKCHASNKHPHRMERTDDSHEATSNADTSINIQQQRQLTMQRMLDTIRHAVQCRNANCLSKNCAQCKILLKHNKECTKVSRQQCSLCSKLFTPIWFHAKTCSDPACPIPHCASFKQKLQRQRAATMQLDRRRMEAMRRANMAPSSSPMNAQTSESNPTPQYQPSMESASPSSSGKSMPSGGKNGKPSTMNSLIRSNLSQPVPVPQSLPTHASYYNGGKGNPAGSGGHPMMMTHSPAQPSQPWFQPPAHQSPSRYPTHGGKPMAYIGPPRMAYNNEQYPSRQPMPGSSYSYPTNTVPPPSYPHPQPMETNSLATVRPNNPMMSQQNAPPRYPQNSYYTHPQGSMVYPQSSPVGPPHRSLSQSNLSSGYSLPSTTVSSNGTGSKPNLIDSIELKSEDTYDDPSKLVSVQSQQQQALQQQQQQQQQMFHPLAQSRSRPISMPFYSNMQPTGNPYYQNQRPMTPNPDYPMAVVRGSTMRSSSIPPSAYGALSNQGHMSRTQLASSTSDLSTAMNSNVMGLPSTSSPAPPSTPR